MRYKTVFNGQDIHQIDQTLKKHMASRIWNSLTDYRFLVDKWEEEEKNEKDQEKSEVRQILKIPALRFWSLIFLALSIPRMPLIFLPMLQLSNVI